MLVPSYRYRCADWNRRRETEGLQMDQYHLPCQKQVLQKSVMKRLLTSRSVGTAQHRPNIQHDPSLDSQRRRPETHRDPTQLLPEHRVRRRYVAAQLGDTLAQGLGGEGIR